ncbi:MAG: hypothetical protein LJE61_10465 [Thiocapsa sp.]|nr:hypothetical protein [Thiocapsa sp.]MCG6985602.1 hypothetical protein [Thiocapsa sp.]
MTRPEQQTTELVNDLMTGFAERTGLVGERPPKRYLWTDAFAVCNFLELERRTSDQSYRELALRLLDQVHHVLGRHRSDDPREGWISGLAADAGERHPTQGGLRIGKTLRERLPDEAFDERLEWERDGQYFHYLTRWMHALARLGIATGEPGYIRWALELAETAFERFSYEATLDGRRRLVWKMSIDLSRPLVGSQGQQDPLDGLVTCLELQHAAATLDGPGAPSLDRQIAGLSAMCATQPLSTADPLGIGGLLTAAHALAQLTSAGDRGYEDLIVMLLHDALPGLQFQAAGRDALSMPADDRLAFRELGLSIGLRALQRIGDLAARHPEAFRSLPALGSRLERLMPYLPLIDAIEDFWLAPLNQSGRLWKEHEDIDAVMLATSLAPAAYLCLSPC